LARSIGTVLLRGLNHVAILTKDSDRLHAFYRDVFEATVFADMQIENGGRLSMIKVGEYTELNVFEWPGNAEADRHQPMFGRGPIDHLGLEAADKESFDEIRRRLIARGAADEFVTDFGAALSIFFVDPDGLECEVLLYNPAATAADMNPPGTPAREYVT
jgi:catechol 2,3-dioxygenase-like lactoylglutathione lyase family enzyme